MHVLVLGASGLVGTHLCNHFVKNGITFSVFSHGSSFHHGAKNAFAWDPNQIISGDPEQFNELIGCVKQVDAVINLAGYSIANGRLDKAHIKKVLGSRVDSVNALVQLILWAKHVPSVWIQASAIGYYGDGADTILDEDSPLGTGELADICHKWESALMTAIKTHKFPIRTVIARLGIVLASDATAWKRMVLPIKCGVAGPLGSGKQWWSWVHINDVVNSFDAFLQQLTYNGVYNITARNRYNSACL